MGAVYQARDAELGVSVALKVIRPDMVADPDTAQAIEQRFKRELLLARQVTHRNVVRIHDLGEINGIKYITMSLVDGVDLATHLAEQTALPVPRALRIARGIVAGLVSAHEAGVVHRDLKPANIMVGADDEPTIMDFGIARSAGGAGQGPVPKGNPGPRNLRRSEAVTAGITMAGAIIGTVEYMAPEQASGVPVDQRADIYALGLILYDMLIGGRRNQRAVSAIAELQARMRQAPPAPRTLNPQIPVAVDAIISKCLEPDQEKRFGSTAELQAAFDRLDENGEHLPIVRRLTRRTMALAGVLVLLLLGGTYFATRQLTAPVIPHAPVTVLIADFQNTTNDPTFDHTLGQTLRRGLESASFITAFDRTRVRPTFGLDAPDIFDEVAARQLAIKQGLGVVLAGSIASRGDGYELTLHATQPMTGNVIASVTRRAANKKQVLPTVTRVVTSVRNALGDQTSESDQQLAMKTISTTSLEVAGQYAAAVHAQSRGNAERALESFARAVQLDPTFGLGYQGLAVMSRNLGRLEDADRYAVEALRYLDGMTERERYATRGYYFSRNGDYKQCVKEYGDLIERYPADVPAHNQRAACLARLRDMRTAVDEMRQVLGILPNHAVYRSNLAVLLNYAGEFSAAEQEIRTIKEPEARALGALALSQQGRSLIRDAANTVPEAQHDGCVGCVVRAGRTGRPRGVRRPLFRRGEAFRGRRRSRHVGQEGRCRRDEAHRAGIRAPGERPQGSCRSGRREGAGQKHGRTDSISDGPNLCRSGRRRPRQNVGGHLHHLSRRRAASLRQDHRWRPRAEKRRSEAGHQDPHGGQPASRYMAGTFRSRAGVLGSGRVSAGRLRIRRMYPAPW